MTASIDVISTYFKRFNATMFASRLPEVPIRLTDSGRSLGQCVQRGKEFELRFSTRIDMPEQQLEDVVIHEMIHLFIMYNGLRDTSPHGHIFKALMESINANYGRHITISVRLTDEQRAQSVSTRRTVRIIAVLELADGSCALKVLPRVAERIADYRRAALRQPSVKSIQLYVHDNPFFNGYPCSAALRYHLIERNALMAQLRGATPLRP